MIDTKQMAKYIFEEYANYYSEVDIEKLAKHLDEIKASAVKECFEKVKKRLAVHSFTSNSTEYTDGQLDCLLWVDSEIYELEKEMVGET